MDANVARLYADRLALALSGHSVLRLEATETNKSLEQFPVYVTHFLEHGIRRTHTLIAVGGGIIQDVTAFLAATLLRGLSWRFYPTTLLAQADSCIGSKSSVNVGPFKNQLGTFTPPDEVLISTDALRTLDERAIRSGLGEMIKVHIIAGWDETRAIIADYPRIVREPLVMARDIRRSLEIKRAKVEADEFDRDERLVMNYGHTFGHAIESATDYAIPHGIAVTIGMDVANYLSWQFGLIDRPLYDELHELLAANYAGVERMPIPQDRFFAALLKDKKRAGDECSLILMRGPGAVFCGRYPDDERLRGACREYLNGLAETGTKLEPCRSQP